MQNSQYFYREGLMPSTEYLTLPSKQNAFYLNIKLYDSSWKFVPDLCMYNET